MGLSCPGQGCSKQFDSYKALSAHQARCKFMPGTIASTAKYYVELDDERARKRQKTSEAGDEEEDTEAIDFEVSWYPHGPKLYHWVLIVLAGGRTSTPPSIPT